MQEPYARIYRTLYTYHWWWRAREEFVVGSLRRCRIRPGGSVLDVGCGDGLFFDRLGEFGTVEGVEPDGQLVTEEGRRRGQIHPCPFDESFGPGKTYSLIVMLDVLEHLPDPVGAVRHALSLLERGGTLFVTVPAFPVLWTAHDDHNCHYVRFTKESLVRVTQSACAKVIWCRYFYHWLFPVKLAIRGKERVCKGQPALPQVPASPINRICYAVSRWEHALFSRLPVPFGSSLMAVMENDE